MNLGTINAQNYPRVLRKKMTPPPIFSTPLQTGVKFAHDRCNFDR